MKKPTTYNLTPARGQALLNFQGRRYPDTVELFETELIEEVKSTKKQVKLLDIDKQKKINSDFKNLLIHGDCLSACAYLKSKNIKVDLVYIDPPFASGANYAKKIFLRNGNKYSIKNDDVNIGEEIMYGDIWQKEDYLNWLYERLLSIRDILSEKGSIFVHLDWHIGHYAKILLDEVFGEDNFRNEIIWAYKFGGRSSSTFPRKHDTIFWYSKSDDYLFSKENCRMPIDDESVGHNYRYTDESGRKYREDIRKSGKVYRYYLDEGKIPEDVWTDIDSLHFELEERIEYATQKPEALVDRIIKAASERGMIVADFFVGSGTTAKVAHSLERNFIACDVGVNAIQATRDRLVQASTSFDLVKIQDGLRLFRNPTQTTAKLFSLIDGYKSRKELSLSDFWDGGIASDKGDYIPVKFVGIHERLTQQLLDVILEEVYQLQDAANAVSKVKIIYAHKDQDIEQEYVNREVRKAGKTNIKIELVSLDNLLAQKKDSLFMPDSADVQVKEEKGGVTVTIKRFFSPYLKAKIDDYNNKKVKKTLLDEEEKEIEKPHKKVAISESGLELIESVQFDTTLRKDGVWVSNTDVEDKAGIKDKIRGTYHLPSNRFKMKIRNIAGDELVIGSEEISKDK